MAPPRPTARASAPLCVGGVLVLLLIRQPRPAVVRPAIGVLRWQIGDGASSVARRALGLRRRIDDDEPSPPPSPEELHQRDVVATIQTLWSTRTGYKIPEAEKLSIANAGKQQKSPWREADGPEAYGEATPVGVRQLGRAMAISSDGYITGMRQYREPINFMDLGCGIGKLVAQAYFEWPSVERATGIELSPTRAAHAREAWEVAISSGEADKLRTAALALAEAGGSAPVSTPLSAEEAVHFVEGDIFKVDVSDATHIYVSSRCFHEAMVRRLALKLGAEATRLQTVATLRPFPEGLEGFKHLGSIGVEMSWTAYRDGGETTHIYTRADGA